MCNQQKPESVVYFYKHSKGFNGLSSKCKECTKFEARTNRKGNTCSYDKKNAWFNRKVKSLEYIKNGIYPCSKCKQVKELNSINFTRDNKRLSGFSSWCRACRYVAIKQRNQKNPDRKRNIGLLWNYNLSLEQFNILFKKQGEKCAICGSKNSGSIRNKNFAVDHKHDATQKIRRILCHPCNQGLGIFKDNVGILKSAIDYLELNS